MFFWFMGAVLATWRVTHLLVREKGPLDVISRIRRSLAGVSGGSVLTCFDCASLWIAIPFTLAVTRSMPTAVVVWLALSGGASLLERWSRDPFEDSLTAERGPTT